MAIHGSQRGSGGIAIESVDGGWLENVVVSSIALDGVSVALFLRLGKRARPHTADAPQPGVGSFRNVQLEGGGRREQATRAVSEHEAEYPRVNIFGDLPAYGIYARHVRGLTLRGVRLHTLAPDARWSSRLRFTQVQNATVAGVRARGAIDVLLKVEGRESRGIVLTRHHPSSMRELVRRAEDVTQTALFNPGAYGTIQNVPMPGSRARRTSWLFSRVTQTGLPFCASSSTRHATSWIGRRGRTPHETQSVRGAALRLVEKRTPA